MTGCFDCHKLMVVDRSGRKSLHCIELPRTIPSIPHKFVCVCSFVCFVLVCSVFAFCLIIHWVENRIGGEIGSVLVSSAVDREFEPQSGETEADYEIGICCFYAKHTALRGKSKDLLARNQDNVSELGDMSAC